MTQSTINQPRLPAAPGRSVAGEWASPAAAGLALLLACTALSGVIGGGAWFATLTVTVVVVVGVGIGLRALRVPALLAGLGQFVALALLVTAKYASGAAILGFIPGPATFGAMHRVFEQAAEQVQIGVAPVPETPPIVCLVVVLIGLVAIVVDTLAAIARAPAACGLVLLCVFAVPAALADNLLPWWSFTLGAAGFALLLTVDGQHRHRSWRNRLGLPSGRTSTGSAPMAAGVAAMSAVIALFVGSTFTVVGTSGQLPFTDPAGVNGVGVQLNPFTSLGGQLRRGRPIELFRVRNLDQHAYLKALTLAKFSTKTGWSQGKLDGRAKVGPNLPLPEGSTVRPSGKVSTIDIEPVGYRDVWLPSYGVPLNLQGVPADSMYDPSAGVAYTQARHKLGPYREQAVLPNPTADQLRSAHGAGEAAIDPQYFHQEPVDPAVTELALKLTSQQITDFDRTLALNKYFTDASNGFSYSLDAGDGSSNDALKNFLFTTKKGFCEQYASAMAIMLRVLGIPSRVVLGFTPGYDAGDYRVITTNDAHAWVEVYFPDYGWLTFDPTPLADGRGEQPSYVVNDKGLPGQKPDGGTDSPSTPTATTTTHSQAGPSSSAAAPVPGVGGNDGGTPGLFGRLLAAVLCIAGIALLTGMLLAGRRRTTAGGRPPLRRILAACSGPVLIVLGIVLAVVVPWASPAQSWRWGLAVIALGTVVALATPAVLRLALRRQRERLVTISAPGAARAAWQELLAESSDRGATAPGSETVRAMARRLAREHALDESGLAGLRTLIAVVEREWYGGHPAGSELTAAFQDVRRSLRRSAPLALRAKLWPRSVLHP